MIDFRDPLFGLFSFLVVVLVASAASYYAGILSEAKKRRDTEDFLKNFEGFWDDENYDTQLKANPRGVNSLFALANAYSLAGEYDKARNIFVALLNNFHLCVGYKKNEILDALGLAYIKVGFLDRAEEVFLESLKIVCRNKQTLRHLQYVYEKSGRTSKTLEVLDVLAELGNANADEKLYLQMVGNEKIASERLNDSSCPAALKRLYLQHLLLNDAKKAAEFIGLSKIEEFIDILWQLPTDKLLSLNKNGRLAEILLAKGESVEAQNGNCFELSVLTRLSLSGAAKLATLEFEYICEKCGFKHIFYFYRCPSCYAFSACKVKKTIVKSLEA